MTTYAGPESRYLGDRYDARASHRNVWIFHVTVTWDGVTYERDIEVWSPRLEPDGDESGVWESWDYEKLVDHNTGLELTDEERDMFVDAVFELLRETG